MRCRGRSGLVVVALLTACKPGAQHDVPDATAKVSAPPPPALVEPPANVSLEPQKVWAAQVKATPDEKEANELVAALKKAGVTAQVQRADLGARGIWFRVLVGAWPRRDLLELHAPEQVANTQVRAILGPVPDGEPAFVAQEVPAGARLTKTLADALGRIAGTEQLKAHLHDAGAKTRVFFLHPTDGNVHVLDEKGTDIETIRIPAASCEGCQNAEGNAAIVSVVEIAGGGEPELIVQVGAPEQRALVVMGKKGKAWETLAGFPAQTHEEYSALAGELLLRQLDTDAELELLWTGAKMTFWEGQSLCKAFPLQQAVDVTPQLSTRPMDDALHAANGVARKHGGSDEIRAFLKGTWDRAPDLALQAALAYLAEAPDDAEIYREVVSRAQRADKEGRRAFQFSAIAGLIAARGEWRAGLAPQLHDLVPLVIKQMQNAVGCDEAPLLTGTLAQKARQDPREALQIASRKADATTLQPRTLAALMTAYPQGSPLADDVAALIELLEQRAPSLVRDARELRKAPQKQPEGTTP